MSTRDYTRHTVNTAPLAALARLGDEYYNPLTNTLYKLVAVNGNSPTFSQMLIASANGAVILNPATAGTIDNMSIGTTTPSTGKFTQLTVNGSIASISPTTGALTVTGGVGIGGTLTVSGVITTNGTNPVPSLGQTMTAAMGWNLT